jgi:hypothetical protein
VNTRINLAALVAFLGLLALLAGDLTPWPG